MKALIISQYYSPEQIVLVSTLARSLSEQGHQVRVLTGYPNYPAGRLFDGYKQQWRQRQTVNGVDVLRVPLWIDHSQNALKRMLNYGSFGLSATTARNFARGADVIYVYATQMTPALGPWLWRMTGGAPYVLHVQDLWPDSITGSSLVNSTMARTIGGLLTPWLSSVYRHASAVIGIAPTMVNTLVDRGVDPQKTHLVYNWAEEGSARQRPATAAASKDPNRTSILYGGNVGDMQALDIAVRAAHQARDSGVHLTIIGDGVALPRIKAIATELQADNVDFLGRVPRTAMGQHYDEADYALVTLKDLPAFRGTIPSKLQASLAHGLAVITTVQGDVRSLVDAHQIGFTAEVEDAESLAAAFRSAAALNDASRLEMSNRARNVYESMFSQTAGIAAIEEILLNAAQTGRSRDKKIRKEKSHAAA